MSEQTRFIRYRAEIGGTLLSKKKKKKTTPRLGLDSPRRRDCGVGSNFPRRNYLSRRLSRCQSFVVHSRGSLPGVSRILLEERYDVSPARRCSWLRQKSENALMKC